MNFSFFKAASVRKDASANDKSHFLSRYFAVPTAYFCYRLGLSANQVTGLFLIVGLAAGAAIYLHMALLGYALWRLHVVLDMADGNLARATKRFSANAVGFDRSNHIAINTTMLLAPLLSSGSILLANALTVAFFLHYFFFRNFDAGAKSSAQDLSLTKSVIRHALGIEGYIAVCALLILSGVPHLLVPAAWIYTMCFLLLFLAKLSRRLGT